MSMGMQSSEWWLELQDHAKLILIRASVSSGSPLTVVEEPEPTAELAWLDSQ